MRGLSEAIGEALRRKEEDRVDRKPVHDARSRKAGQKGLREAEVRARRREQRRQGR